MSLFKKNVQTSAKFTCYIHLLIFAGLESFGLSDLFLKYGLSYDASGSVYV